MESANPNLVTAVRYVLGLFSEGRAVDLPSMNMDRCRLQVAARFEDGTVWHTIARLQMPEGVKASEPLSR
jgi:hypothetical protein